MEEGGDWVAEVEEGGGEGGEAGGGNGGEVLLADGEAGDGRVWEGNGYDVDGGDGDGVGRSGDEGAVDVGERGEETCHVDHGDEVAGTHKGKEEEVKLVAGIHGGGFG